MKKKARKKPKRKEDVDVLERHFKETKRLRKEISKTGGGKKLLESLGEHVHCFPDDNRFLLEK